MYQLIHIYLLRDIDSYDSYLHCSNHHLTMTRYIYTYTYIKNDFVTTCVDIYIQLKYFKYLVIENVSFVLSFHSEIDMSILNTHTHTLYMFSPFFKFTSSSHNNHSYNNHRPRTQKQQQQQNYQRMNSGHLPVSVLVIARIRNA